MILNRIFMCHFLNKNYEESLVTGLQILECLHFEDDPDKKIKANSNVA